MRPYFSEGGITIYHGDNREVLPDLTADFSLVVTDPPYNAKKQYGEFADNLSALDYAEWMRSTVAHCRRLAKKQFWVAPRYQIRSLAATDATHSAALRRRSFLLCRRSLARAVSGLNLKGY